jgi:DNA primase
VLTLPDNADPDEFIRNHGVGEYNKRRGEAPELIQFIIDLASQDRDLHRTADRAEAVEEVLPYIWAVPNFIEKRESFDKAMYAFHVDKTLREEIWQQVKRSKAAIDGDVASKDIKQKIARAEAAPLTVAEQRLLELLAHDAELRREILPRLEEDDYGDLPSGRVYAALKEIEREGVEVDFSALASRTEGDAVAADLVPLVLMGESPRAEGEAADDTLAEAESCLAALKLMSVERRLRGLAAEINEAERVGDEARRDSLVLESLDLTRRRNALLPRT